MGWRPARTSDPKKTTWTPLRTEDDTCDEHGEPLMSWDGEFIGGR
jgi:hypothetical protein